MLASTNRFIDQIEIQGKSYNYLHLNKVAHIVPIVHDLPLSLKILLENILRFADDVQVVSLVKSFCESYFAQLPLPIEFRPSRVLMQDFTGVPAVVDLAAMRDALRKLKQDPSKINPACPVDLVIDHSVMVDVYATGDSYTSNVAMEFARNRERYEFLKWAQKSFRNFRVVPPGTGICHQVNLEYLAEVVWHDADNAWIYPDTVVGTDSHTTMINGLGVLGWGVGGIEAEAAMMDQPLSMLVPEVVGVELKGGLPEGATSTDLVLTITKKLREKGVVGKFVEFWGEGLNHLSLEERATVANMCPEYGATAAFFPVDEQTLSYLRLTNRSEETLARVEAYSKKQGLWRNSEHKPSFTVELIVDLTEVRTSLAGPKRPQDQVLLGDVKSSCERAIAAEKSVEANVTYNGSAFALGHGHVVIAAITSCTNTSNPNVMIAAGLLARKARALGLVTKPWVKTSLAPGSQIVTEYLVQSGLMKDLEALGFHVVGYGCTTCIGNSGPLAEPIAKAIDEHELSVGAVLSGNRNFEGRVHPQVKLNYLASPPLVVAFALAGTLKINMENEPLGIVNGREIFLKDVWPSTHEIQNFVQSFIHREMFAQKYKSVFAGTDDWQSIATQQSMNYQWDGQSTYIQCPPYFDNIESTSRVIPDIKQAYTLAIYGDSITTDHISPAGNIRATSPAGQFLQQKNVAQKDFNSYGARRGNHEVMMRGTFANIRIQNEMTPQTTGNWTRYVPENQEMPLFDASEKYRADNCHLVIVAGKEYGSGSSRDWAAKGPKLLGVSAVIAESFERIHRSNLVGMGILPLTFVEGCNRHTLGLKGQERWTIVVPPQFDAHMIIDAVIHREGQDDTIVPLKLQVNTPQEYLYLQHGGIMPYVVRHVS